MELTHPHPDRFTEKEANKKSERWRRFLKKNYCEPIVTDGHVWCQVPGDAGEPWSVILHDLMPDKLWDLPKEIERDCGWMREDGEAVGIEILDGNRRHFVSYSNPDLCCADVACAVANHVRTVVRRMD